jgi:murein DD-endopeptidase MepM/ murein hydrolase activator NlpD
MRIVTLVMLSIVGASRLLAQDASRDDRIKPEQLGLPKGTERTSEPFVTRVYKVDAAGRFLKEQPKGYPFTITKDYELRDDEDFRTHQGVDFSSRPAPGEKPVPLDFKAGVYGTVVKAGDGQWGPITVQIHDGTLIQYLHTLASHVKVGAAVTPETQLGITGRTGTGVIHLHIQAKDKNGFAISPDLAFRLGQTKLQCKEKPDGALLDFDPDIHSPVKAKVIGRKVSAIVEPESKWIVEVIGGGGKVDLVLGEFYDYQSASRCAVAWAESRPDDLRLTREREVKLKPQKP